MDKTYSFVFTDNTTGGQFSKTSIVTGASSGAGESGAALATGAKVASGVQNKLVGELLQKGIAQPLNAVTGGLATPTIQIAKSLSTGSYAALGAGVAGLAIKGVEVLIQSIQDRIAKLEEEAKSANDLDNTLIRAGSLNITGAGISYTNRGRAVYKFDRS